MLCRSSTAAAARSTVPPSNTPPPGCANCSPCLAAGVGEVAIERPDGPVVDTLLAAGITVVVISPNQVKNLRGRYGSAGNKDDRFDAFVLADTLRTDRARLRAADPRQRGHRRAAAGLPGPQGPGRPPGRARQPAARPPAQRLPRRGRPVRRDRLPDQPGLPGPLRHPRPRRLAHARSAWPPGWPRRLLRPRRPRRCCTPGSTAAPRGAIGDHGTAQAHITRALRRRAHHPGRPDQGHVDPDQRTTRPARRRAHLHQPAPRRPRPRRPAARRDRRLPRPVPHPRSRWPASPASHPPPANPARSAPSASAGPATNNSATPSPTSPATPAAPTPGPPTSTAEPAPEATTTPTPSASSPAPGSTSSGTAGKTTPPTTPPNTAPSNGSSTKINNRRLDTGHLMRPAGRGQWPDRSPPH